MKSFSRATQISKQIQRGVSDILQQGLRDPRLELTTITGVKVSADLGKAYVYYIVNGHRHQGQTDAAAGFKSAGGFIKRTLAQRLKLKYMPELCFCYDESFDYGEKIDHLLENL